MAEATQSPSGAPLAAATPMAATRWLAIVGGGVVVLGVFLVVGASARPDEATLGLLLVGLALVACLRTMHRIVGALARDDLEVAVESDADLGGISDRELREERRRLLRAINELRFDHEMGKLSKADYDSVRQGYELRALEVMRALEGGRSLHPELAERLGLPPVEPADDVAQTKADPDPTEIAEDLAAPAPPAESPTDAPKAQAATVACAKCDGTNDADARFCKHCGKEIAA